MLAIEPTLHGEFYGGFFTPADSSQAAAPTVSLLDESAKIVTSRPGRDRFRVAGTAEFTDTTATSARIASLPWCGGHVVYFPG